MGKISEVVSSKVQDGTRLVKVTVLGPKDVQEIPQVTPHGIDSAPPTGTKALLVETVQKGDAVISGCITPSKELNEGELRLSSTNADGVEQIYMQFNDDGTIDVGGDSHNMIRYAPMETAFNSLRDKVNELIVSYNTHTHITTATVGPSTVPGVIAPTTSQETVTTVDMTASKIEEIKTL